MKNIIQVLILLFLSIVAGLAQDFTCNAGDIAWVKETVAADTGHTTGTTGAAYNDFTMPFGIQRVYDQACAGLDIRIVAGAGLYGSTTASWTGRDSSNFRIQIDTVNGTSPLPIKVSGWVDETTEGECPNTCTILDFEKAIISGDTGFEIISRSYYAFKNIRLQNTDARAWSLNNSTILVLLYQCEATLATGDGFGVDGGGNTFYRIRGFSNNNRGIEIAGGNRVLFSEFSGNASNTSTTRGALSSYGSNSIMIKNIVRGNTRIGCQVFNAGNQTFLFNTCDSNGGHGLELGSTAQIIIGNNITNNVGDGLNAVTGDIAVLDKNNYFGNTGTDKNVTVAVEYDGDIPADITNPGYISSTNLQPAGSAVDFTVTFPAGLTQSLETRGAAHSAGGSTGGNNVAY